MSAALQLLCLVSIGENHQIFHASSSEVMLVRIKSDADAQGCAELAAMLSAQVSPSLGALVLSRCQLIVTIFIMIMIMIVIGLHQIL